MKLLTVVLHAQEQQPLADLLRSLIPVTGYTLTNVEGFGHEREAERFLAAHDDIVGQIPRVRADVLLEESDMENVLQSVKALTTSERSQGVYWVTDIEQGGHIQ